MVVRELMNFLKLNDPDKPVFLQVFHDEFDAGKKGWLISDIQSTGYDHQQLIITGHTTGIDLNKWNNAWKQIEKKEEQDEE